MKLDPRSALDYAELEAMNPKGLAREIPAYPLWRECRHRGDDHFREKKTTIATRLDGRIYGVLRHEKPQLAELKLVDGLTSVDPGTGTVAWGRFNQWVAIDNLSRLPKPSDATEGTMDAAIRVYLAQIQARIDQWIDRLPAVLAELKL